jgi:hypothetical protein
MLEIILIAVGSVVVLFLVLAALQSSEFRVVRSAAMAAPPPAVFAQVNDFHLWEAWSPWAKIDPTMKQTYEGPAAGVGAISNWSGDGKAGQGRMTLTESRPHDLIQIRLEFMKPWQATNAVEFTFQPDGEQTIVKWSMSGKKNFFLKAFGLFMSMDKMVGRDFEKGLAQLRTVVETTNKQ